MLIEFREKKTRRKQTNVVFHALGQQEGEKTTRKVRMKMGLLTCSVWAWFQWTSNSGAPKLLLKNSSWIPQKDKQMIFYITQKRNQMSSTTQRDFSGMNLLLLLSGQSSSTAYVRYRCTWLFVPLESFYPQLHLGNRESSPEFRCRALVQQVSTLACKWTVAQIF